MLELRRQIEKQSTDLGATHRSLSDLRSKNAELEERLIQVNKELHQAQELAKSLEIELNENVAQKGDQEERIATLEKRYFQLLYKWCSLNATFYGHISFNFKIIFSSGTWIVSVKQQP